jgi:hypothetical protein
MKKTLLLSTRYFFMALALPLLLISCESDPSEPTPVAGPTTTEFAMVDSIKVDAFFQSSNPEIYQKYQDKTYQVKSTNKVETYFVAENNYVYLYFKENSQEKEQPWIAITFQNRTLENLPLTLSLKEASMVCVQQGQGFKDGSAVLSPGCMTILDGVISLQYDPATKVINGAVTNLKFGIDFYVPDYAFPNWNGNIFKASGSSRNLNIKFENVKRK